VDLHGHQFCHSERRPSEVRSEAEVEESRRRVTCDAAPGFSPCCLGRKTGLYSSPEHRRDARGPSARLGISPAGSRSALPRSRLQAAQLRLRVQHAIRHARSSCAPPSMTGWLATAYSFWPTVAVDGDARLTRRGGGAGPSGAKIAPFGMTCRGGGVRLGGAAQS
jgi:hypothetical protein